MRKYIIKRILLSIVILFFVIKAFTQGAFVMRSPSYEQSGQVRPPIRVSARVKCQLGGDELPELLRRCAAITQLNPDASAVPDLRVYDPLSPQRLGHSVNGGVGRFVFGRLRIIPFLSVEPCSELVTGAGVFRCLFSPLLIQDDPRPLDHFHGGLPGQLILGYSSLPADLGLYFCYCQCCNTSLVAPEGALFFTCV